MLQFDDLAGGHLWVEEVDVGEEVTEEEDGAIEARSTMPGTIPIKVSGTDPSDM